MADRIVRGALICILGIYVAACAHTSASAAPTRIDGSTPESFNSSWNRLYNSLTPQQKSQLSVAILPIALGKYKSFMDVPSSTLAGIGPQDIRTQIDGMTFEEILALAQRQPIKVSAPNRP